LPHAATLAVFAVLPGNYQRSTASCSAESLGAGGIVAKRTAAQLADIRCYIRCYGPHPAAFSAPDFIQSRVYSTLMRKSQDVQYLQ
jgi:hypothetical protein